MNLNSILCNSVFRRGIGILSLYSLMEPYFLQHKKIVFRDSRFPEKYDGLKIIFLSDIHFGPFFNGKRLRNLIEKINSRKPHWIFLGGDYIQKRKYLYEFCDEISCLKSQWGKYAVFGNHDFIEGIKDIREGFRWASFQCLDNQAVIPSHTGEDIVIGGVEDYLESRQNVDCLLNQGSKHSYRILLSHNPDYVEHVSHLPIDLAFCGHTHGGQVTILGKWAPFIPSRFGQKYREGFVFENKIAVYISKGVGVSPPPVRFCSPPEWIEMDLYHLKDCERKNV